MNHPLLKIIKRTFCLFESISSQNKTASKFQLKNFSDQVKLTLTAGKGGNGSIAYFTDKKIRKGKPDGGDGGIGGDIVLQTHEGLHDLSHLRRKDVHGYNGANGGPQGKNGKNGGKFTIRVPIGTLVYEVKCQQQTQRKKFLVDLSQNKMQYLIAKGGNYGKGNKMNPGVTNDTRYGLQGQNKIIHLELKILADIGLVGFPNIGKSTFLAAVSRALPKIANYQFTTLKPSIGYVKFVDDFKMTIADIPGIIQDAHQDKGLGLEFLRHIQRTKILIIMLDITKNPLKQYQTLLKQLKQYKSSILLQKQRIIVLNKKDCLAENQNFKANQILDRISNQLQNQRCFMISAKQGAEGKIGDVLVYLRKIVQKQSQKQRMLEKERKDKQKLQQLF